MESYSRGRRGCPAKALGRETGARVQIPDSPPSNVKYEHQTQKVYYVFVDGLFGIVIYRKNTDK